MQVCWEPSEHVAFKSKALSVGTGLGQGPVPGPVLQRVHSPLTPGAWAAGDWDEADCAGDPEVRRQLGLRQSSAGSADRAVRGYLGKG